MTRGSETPCNLLTVQNLFADHIDVLMRLALNIVAMSIHVFGIYYQRYRN